jgi:hypothetical protein
MQHVNFLVQRLPGTVARLVSLMSRFVLSAMTCSSALDTSQVRERVLAPPVERTVELSAFGLTMLCQHYSKCQERASGPVWLPSLAPGSRCDTTVWRPKWKIRDKVIRYAQPHTFKRCLISVTTFIFFRR